MQKIADFVGALKGARLRGITRASRAVPFLMDHAASPMESVLALMLRLPIVRGGLGLGLPKLNADVPIGEEYQRFTVARHVYPDIFFEELPLDIEYESEEFHPEMGDWDALDPASRDAILGKTKKDKQRMRLIQTMGIRVFQVTFDDFKTSASFDLLTEQLLKQIEDLSGKSQRRKRAQLNSTKAILKRSSMLASLLEGSPTVKSISVCKFATAWPPRLTLPPSAAFACGLSWPAPGPWTRAPRTPGRSRAGASRPTGRSPP